MTNSRAWVVVALAGALGVVAIRNPVSAATESPTTVSPSDSRKAAPALALGGSNGRTITLSALRGKVVLLDFWATWCTGCKLEIPWFIEFEKKYRAHGLTAVGVAVDDEGWQTIKPYLAQHPIPYPVVLGNMDVLQKTFGLPASLPVTILIDRRGRIASTHAGVVERKLFEEDIQRLLAEPAK